MARSKMTVSKKKKRDDHDEIVRKIKDWMEDKHENEICKRFKENRVTGGYSRLIDDNSVLPNRQPRTDLGFKLRDGSYIFIEIESKGSPANRNVAKYWQLMDYWKDKGIKDGIPRVLLIHVLLGREEIRPFSWDDNAKFIACKIREKTKVFQYVPLCVREGEKTEEKVKEIKEKIRDFIVNCTRMH